MLILCTTRLLASVYYLRDIRHPFEAKLRTTTVCIFSTHRKTKIKWHNKVSWDEVSGKNSENNDICKHDKYSSVFWKCQRYLRIIFVWHRFHPISAKSIWNLHSWMLTLLVIMLHKNSSDRCNKSLKFLRVCAWIVQRFSISFHFRVLTKNKRFFFSFVYFHVKR